MDLRQFLGYGFINPLVYDFDTALVRHYYTHSFTSKYARRLIYIIATTDNGKSDAILVILVIIIGNEVVVFFDFCGNC